MEINDSNRSLFEPGPNDGSRSLLPNGAEGSSGCKHCGLPLPEGVASAFCCSGCAVAYEAIRLAGLDRTYYSLRHLSDAATGVPAKPSSASVLSKQQISSQRFVDESTKDLGNGKRRVCLAIDGLTCAACGWLAEQVVSSQNGMQRASVNLPDATLTFDFEPEKASLPTLLDTLARFGYELHPRKQRPHGASETERRLLTKVGISWALAGNIMLLAFALYSGLSLDSDPVLATAARWASLLIATIAVSYGGSVFFRTAIASIRIAIRQRSLQRLHIDTPISLGIIVGYSNSAWATVAGRGDVWFDSIAVLIAALLTARWLQTRSQRKAAQAASRLLDMVPSTARKILADGSEEYVASVEVKPGERIRVDPGEVISVDGGVLSGRSSVNNAVITGESAPISVQAGDNVFAGAINQSSPLVLSATSSGRHTRVGQLLEWLEVSTRSQAPVVQMADRISGVFVVAVLVAAIGTAVAGLFLFPDSAVTRVVALLVISCPCALGMATPLAIAAANGKAARRGIYVKDGATVETLANITTVVFDKTGTLTEGDLSVVSFEGSDSALEMAATIEQYSRHPIAAAIVGFAREQSGFQTDNTAGNAGEVTVHAGRGVHGHVRGHEVMVGRPDWIAKHASSGVDALADIDEIASDGYTPVAVAIDGEVSAVLACGDRIRPQSAMEVKRLTDSGIRVLLLSGDHPNVVS
ncbi:MAG: heavy metal translocating P-type ATPase, partial [Rhodothermales bacterium]|nr:heavy metal translocating P-type ATPase [Rhodothermales bacterium]